MFRSSLATVGLKLGIAVGAFALAVAVGALGAYFISSSYDDRSADEHRPVVSKPSEVAEAVRPEIDEASIRSHLAHLTGGSTAPLESGAVTIAERGSVQGRRAAAEYMEESFEEGGVPARILEFTSGEGRGFNVEATLPGTGGEKHLWVTAHLDSVHNAGANDNASGLVMLLLTAKALKGLELEHTVHLVAYDLEEIGLVGSHQYMYTKVIPLREREGEEAIIGNVNADMISYEQNEWNAFITNCAQTGPLDDALAQAARAIDPPIALSKRCLEGPGREVGSDHQNFWDAGLPATTLTDDGFLPSAHYPENYPCYHKPCDTADKVNVTYLRSMTQLVATASALLAVPKPGQTAS